MSEQYTETPPTKPGAYWWKESMRGKIRLANVTAVSLERRADFCGLWCGPLVPETELTATHAEIKRLRLSIPGIWREAKHPLMYEWDESRAKRIMEGKE